MKEKFPDWVQQDADYFLCLNLQSFILKSPLPPSINSAEEQRNLQEHIQSFGEYHKYDTRMIQIIHSFGECILTYRKAAAVDKYVATNIVWPNSKVILGKCYLFLAGIRGMSSFWYGLQEKEILQLSTLILVLVHSWKVS